MLRNILDILLAVAIFALAALVWMNVDRVATRQFIGTAHVGDGDSLRLAGERIRLRGIDAPELNQVCRRDGADYPCGRQARDALSALVAGATLVCEGWETDRYGRRLATCRASGIEVNRRLVEQGWAVAYGGYEAEEASAREAGRGLWAGTFDPPRRWRDQHGGLAEGEHDLLRAAIHWLGRVLGFS